MGPWPFIAPALAYTALFFAIPFVVMAVVSLWTLSGTVLDTTPSFGNYVRFFTTESFFKALTNSLEVTALVTIVSVVLAYPMAWILAEKVPLRWQRLALILAILPFWTSYVVRSYAWLLVLAEKGVINSWLLGIGASQRADPDGQYALCHRARFCAFLRHAIDADDLR